MKGFLLLLSFMTRIPMPKIDYDEEKLGKSMKYFPAVGVIVGIILLFFCIVFTFVFKNLNYSTVLPLMIIVVILTDLITTGGLHLDGLADTFDGIFSYRSKHKMLEIMKKHPGINKRTNNLVNCIFCSTNIASLSKLYQTVTLSPI